MSDLSDSLPSLITKEGTLRIHSHPSLQKTDHERFAQVAHAWQKRSGGDLVFFTSESLFRSQKTSESLKKPMSKFPTLPKSGQRESLKVWKFESGQRESSKV